MSHPAYLALADGTIFAGVSVGATGQSTGEVVFHTAMTGHQEILGDPACAGQILVFSCPHVGNTGTTRADDEAGTPRLAGVVLREPPTTASSWRSQGDLQRWLREHAVVAIAGIDTRRLVRALRDRGSQGGCIAAGDEASPAAALDAARAWQRPPTAELLEAASCGVVQPWVAPEVSAERGLLPAPPSPRWRVAVLDLGVRRSDLRRLAEHGCQPTLFPAGTPASELLAASVDGFLVAGGPGDPRDCPQQLAAVRALLAAGRPLFGLGLGHQLLALAVGARVEALRRGHRSSNHPVQHLASKRVAMCMQNHGYAVVEASLPGTVRATHRSLIDGSNQGFELLDKPVFTLQALPGFLEDVQTGFGGFARFVGLMQAATPIDEGSQK